LARERARMALELQAQDRTRVRFSDCLCRLQVPLGYMFLRISLIPYFSYAENRGPLTCVCLLLDFVAFPRST